MVKNYIIVLVALSAMAATAIRRTQQTQQKLQADTVDEVDDAPTGPELTDDYAFPWVRKWNAKSKETRIDNAKKAWTATVTDVKSPFDCPAESCTCMEEGKEAYARGGGGPSTPGTAKEFRVEYKDMTKLDGSSLATSSPANKNETGDLKAGHVAPPEGCEDTTMAAMGMGAPENDASKLCRTSRLTYINNAFKRFNVELFAKESKIEPEQLDMAGFSAAIVIGGKLLNETAEGALPGGGDDIVKLLVATNTPTFSFSRSSTGLQAAEAGQSYTHFSALTYDKSDDATQPTQRAQALGALAEAVNKIGGKGKVAIFYFFATTGGPNSKEHEGNVEDAEEFNVAMGDIMNSKKSVMIHATTFHTSPKDTGYNDFMALGNLFQYDMSKILQTLTLAKGRCTADAANKANKDVCESVECMLNGGDECTFGGDRGQAGGLKEIFKKYGPSKDAAKQNATQNDADLAYATSVSRALYFDTANTTEHAGLIPKALAEVLNMGMVKIPFMLSNTIAVRRLDAFYPSAYTANKGFKNFAALSGCGYNALFGSVSNRLGWVVSTVTVAQWHLAAAKYILQAGVSAALQASGVSASMKSSMFNALAQK